MTSALAERSVVLGQQEPRYWHAPDSVTSGGDECIECAAQAGLHLDEWQQFVLRAGLGERPDGNWAAREVGVCVPRQNGKGGIIEALELYWLFVLNEPLVIHSAHLFDTSQEAMRRLVALIEDTPAFSRRVQAVRNSNGQEGVYLKSGARIRFKTRTKGGGRGLTAPKLVLDEAMYLPDEVMGAVMPTMSAMPEAQAWYLGSAVDQLVHDHGVQFARVRERGMAGDADLAYFEWSADANTPDDTLDFQVDDPAVWADANPAYGIRITERAIQMELHSLARRTFLVERCGVGDWPRTDGLSDVVIDPQAWTDITDADSQIEGPVWFAFDVSPDRKRASIAAAGKRKDGMYHIEFVHGASGTGWVADKCAQLQADHKPVGFICDSVGPAKSLLPELERAGVSVEVMNTSDHAEACAFLYDQVEQRTVRHPGHPALDSSVRGAVKRPLEDRWAWSRKNSSVDISPLVSATFALWGAASGPKEKLLAVMFT